jgi:hypothetical protein
MATLAALHCRADRLDRHKSCVSQRTILSAN